MKIPLFVSARTYINICGTPVYMRIHIYKCTISYETMTKVLDIFIWGIVGHKICQQKNFTSQVPEMRTSETRRGQSRTRQAGMPTVAL
jgi:hypothetical protein